MNTLTVKELRKALEFYNDDLEVVVPFLNEETIEHEAPEIDLVTVDCPCGHENNFLVLFPPSAY